jgi:hypothetical protein
VALRCIEDQLVAKGLHQRRAPDFSKMALTSLTSTTEPELFNTIALLQKHCARKDTNWEEWEERLPEGMVATPGSHRF